MFIAMNRFRVAKGPKQPYFAVGFRDAAVRVVFPAYGDPLRYRAASHCRAKSLLGGERSIDVLHFPDRQDRIV